MRDDLVNEIVAAFILAASFISAWVLVDYHRFTITPLLIENDVSTYDIPSGSTVSSIANDFEKNGWIKHKEYLKFYAKYHELLSIKKGEYSIDKNMTAIDLLNKLVDGKVILHRITLVEGWNFKQMMSEIQKHPAIKQTLSDKSAKEIMTILGKPSLHHEGQFLPDTYLFSAHTADIEILMNSHEAMQTVINTQWPRLDKTSPIKSSYEMLILASIVEKETGAVEERSLIAAVFLSRLNKKMKLQTDPTVIYGMGENYKGNIKRKHLKEDTPYNTYVHRGLPPTPISMPGKAAIKAVIEPDERGYLYFVSKGDGTHYFSKTLSEHNAAVRKYQLKK